MCLHLTHTYHHCYIGFNRLSLCVLKVWFQSCSVAVLEVLACGWWFILWTVSSLAFRSCLWQANRQGFSKPSWPLLVLKVGRRGVWCLLYFIISAKDVLARCAGDSILCEYKLKSLLLPLYIREWLFLSLVFRCEGTLLWSYPHNDTHLSCKRSTVPGLWGEPETHDEAVWLKQPIYITRVMNQKWCIIGSVYLAANRFLFWNEKTAI